jgi:regulatory protein
MSENLLYTTALNKAMALCARREYCISDIRARLADWGAGDKESDKIIGLLIRERFINEERYATGFVKDKFNYNRWGKIKIGSHLRAKKIPEELILKALDSIGDDNYKKVLGDLIAAHRRSVKARNSYELKAKLLRYGLSKGFESSLLYELLNDPRE